MDRTMTHGYDTLLQGHPLLRTQDLSEARDVVGRAFCDHRLELGRGERLDVVHDHVSGRHVSLNALGYGGEVEIDPGLLGEFYLLQIPLAGKACIRHRGEEVVACRDRATLLNPDRETRMTWGAGCRKLLLQVDRAHLEQVAEEMIGTPLPGPVRFDPAVDLTRPAGARMLRQVTGAAAAATRGELWAGRPGLSEIWTERELAEALLTLQPSNVSHMLWRQDLLPTAPQLRRAVEYIHDNLVEPIRVDDIATHAGLNLRSLQLGFRRAFGLSPKQYLRDVRLDMARYRLSRRQDRESVSDVAWSCGFSHLGRFSRDYRARFGECPSTAHGPS
ncbi:MAG: AraC family transcriptional regulator [Maritimibacter harenae]